jgi:hypothetical protein
MTALMWRHCYVGASRYAPKASRTRPNTTDALAVERLLAGR